MKQNRTVGLSYFCWFPPRWSHHWSRSPLVCSDAVVWTSVLLQLVQSWMCSVRSGRLLLFYGFDLVVNLLRRPLLESLAIDFEFGDFLLLNNNFSQQNLGTPNSLDFSKTIANVFPSWPCVNIPQTLQGHVCLSSFFC